MRKKYMNYELSAFIKKHKQTIAGGFSLCLCMITLATVAACGRSRNLYDGDFADNLYASETTKEAEATQAEAYVEVITESEQMKLIVHLCGAVNSPGVYELEADSRIMDGVNVAGGFTEDACVDALNLAMPLEDGSRVYVPNIDEVGERSIALTIEEVAEADGGYVTSGKGTGQESDKVNINTADEATLTTLTGIGAKRASDIIAYREAHGAFNSPEDIMQVRGIKQASFDKIKDRITVR